MYFDEARLDDPAVLSAADLRLRGLAETGARVRRELDAAAPARGRLQQRLESRPRAVVVAGAEAELLEVLLATVSPVPVIRLSGGTVPGWVGALDLVVISAVNGEGPEQATVVAEASRRGCPLLLAAPHGSWVAEQRSGPDAIHYEVATADDLAVAVALLDALTVVGVGHESSNDAAAILDDVAVDSSPYREFSLNPAKLTAIALADSLPLLWGSDPVTALAAREIARSIAGAGIPAIAGRTRDLTPLLEASREVSIFDDPWEQGGTTRPSLSLCGPETEPGDSASGDVALAERRQLRALAEAKGVRVETLSSEEASGLGRYLGLRQRGAYIAEYLRIGSVAEG